MRTPLRAPGSTRTVEDMPIRFAARTGRFAALLSSLPMGWVVACTPSTSSHAGDAAVDASTSSHVGDAAVDASTSPQGDTAVDAATTSQDAEAPRNATAGAQDAEVQADAGADEGLPEPYATLVTTWAARQADCGRYAPIPAALVAIVDPTVRALTTLELDVSLVRAALHNPQVAANPEGALACTVALREASCYEVVRGLRSHRFAACFDVFSGSVDEGGACRDRFSCRDGECQREPGQTCGTCHASCASDEGCAETSFCAGTSCVPRLAEGVACRGREQCVAGLSCVDGHCGPSVEPGGTCDSSEECGVGLFCDRTNRSHCTLKLPAQAPCGPPDACVDGLFCMPQPNGDRLCLPPQAAGADCYGSIQCADGLSCMGFLDGNRCDRPRQQVGDRCDPSTGSYSCDYNLALYCDPVSSTCQSYIGVEMGEPCDEHRLCKGGFSSTFCGNDRLCQPRVALGARCDSGLLCVNDSGVADISSSYCDAADLTCQTAGILGDACSPIAPCQWGLYCNQVGYCIDPESIVCR